MRSLLQWYRLLLHEPLLWPSAPQVPLLRMAAWFAIGVVLEDVCGARPGTIAALAALALGGGPAALRLGLCVRFLRGDRDRRLECAVRLRSGLAIAAELVLGAALGALALALRVHAPLPALEPGEPVVLRVLDVSWSSADSCRIDVRVGGDRPGRARLWAAPPLCAAVPGQRWLALAELESLRPATNPGGSDPRRAARRRGIRARLRLVGERVEPIRDRPGWNERVAALRERLNQVLDPAPPDAEPAAGLRLRAVNPRARPGIPSAPHGVVPVPPRIGLEPAWSRAAGPLLRALVTGDRSRLPAADQERFLFSGTAHLIAVSGLNVACVYALVRALVAALLGALPWPGVLRRATLWAAAAGGAAAVGYTLISGLGVPALRAALMASAGVIAVLGGRPGAAANALGGAALVVLALDPASLFDASFLLSFSAVAGILAWRPPARAGALLAALHTTLGASLATAPWLALFGLPLPLGSLVANAIAVPAFGLVVPLGLAVAVTGALIPPAAAWLGPLARAATALAAAPLAALESSDGFRSTPAPLLAALALACAGFALRSWTLGRRRSAAALLAGALLCIAAQPLAMPAPPGLPRFTFLDVGHGDAILVQDRERAVLIDAGDARGAFDAGRAIVVPALRALGVRRLDALILTHADRDHVGGAAAVLRGVAVDEVWLAPATLDHPALEPLRQRTARDRVPLRLVRDGQRARIGRLELRLHAAPPELARASPNAGSLVLEIRTPYGCAVLPGDAPSEVELALAPALGRCALLKLGHHGSRSSSAAQWLDRIAPRLAVVSAGRRPSSPLPHRDVIARLAVRATPWLGTEQNGAIAVELGPRGLRLLPGWGEAHLPGWEPAERAR